MANPQSASIKPEMRLLLACARQSFAADSAPAIGDLAGDAIDWSAFVDLATAHGLISVAYQALKPHAPMRVPHEIIVQLRLQWLSSAANSAMLSHELTQLVASFADANIDVLAYKGPVLATLLYGSVAPRRFSDLDLLVRAEDVARAEAILLRRGYRSRLQLEWEHSFVCENDQRMVDLHWAFTGNEFRLVMDFDAVWQRMQRVTVGNRSVPALGLPDTLLLQCINAAKDDWASLSQVYEVGQFLRLYALDWEALLVQARAVGCERIVKLAMWLAQRLFGAPLPMGVQRSIAEDATIGKLGEQVLTRLFEREAAGGVANDRMRAQMRERLRDKWPACRRILRFVLLPNEKDRELVALPSYFGGLYFLVRPLRLLIKNTSLGKFVSRSQS